MTLFDLPVLEGEIAKLEAKQNEEGFWDDPNSAKVVMARYSALTGKVGVYKKSLSAYKDINDLLAEAGEKDLDMLELIK